MEIVSGYSYTWFVNFSIFMRHALLQQMLPSIAVHQQLVSRSQSIWNTLWGRRVSFGVPWELTCSHFFQETNTCLWPLVVSQNLQKYKYRQTYVLTWKGSFSGANDAKVLFIANRYRERSKLDEFEKSGK